VLDVITDYISQARILLQDTDQPYRYGTADLVSAFNIAVMESRRLRPDMWLGVTTLPAFSSAATTQAMTNGNTLTFAASPSGVAFGQSVFDTDTANVVQSTNTVSAVTSNTVVLASNVNGTVNNGDVIVFGPGTIAIDVQYRQAFVYYIVGNTEMRDDESTQDTRAAEFMQAFKSTLVGAL
jgi:hypothetical protein